MAFTKSNTYGPFFNKFTSIIGGDLKMMHADFQPEGALNKAFAAPVTEFATFYFDGEPAAGYIDDVMKCASIIENEAEGYLGGAVGITYETVEHEGVKGKAAVLAIGWQSREGELDIGGEGFGKW